MATTGRRLRLLNLPEENVSDLRAAVFSERTRLFSQAETPRKFVLAIRLLISKLRSPKCLPSPEPGGWA